MIREWRIWRMVRKVVKEHGTEFYAIGFDHDWLGRLYAVVNIPDEIIEMPLQTRKDYVMQNMMIDNYIKDGLTDMTELLNKLRLSDLIMFPNSYERFENTDSILLILSPERRYTQPWKVILYFLLMSGVLTGLICLITVLIHLI